MIDLLTFGRGRRGPGRPARPRLGVVQLEARETPAVFAHFAAGTGTLTVTITDGSSGPAGARLISSNSSPYSHEATISGQDNGSTNRVMVNGTHLTLDNTQVTDPNAGNLVRKQHVQQIVVNGSASADLVRLDLIGPGRGWNSLNGRVTVRADGGGDTVKGSGFDDKLYGGGGDDHLYGGGGRDAFDGGSGADTVHDFQVGVDVGVWTALPGVERVVPGVTAPPHPPLRRAAGAGSVSGVRGPPRPGPGRPAGRGPPPRGR